ncbi:nickel pincer cofactor biosynthesis protein LarC [Microcoleus sp. FACHB-1515]|uniref:nickel pincer cofactor biosynthesis protein LarC n=1 Tax=Cyanophyceae TaxID=3028117 RepID=UPI001684480B|nr:nickel pincer cofactor biosynthesis protein LarC [Microcoleus sp. FACHB-1515]MBD2091865.1 nickel pincer cofactor biosynthesis protein LarC [Microcoleus sp. FACHB-1515]
MPKLAYLDCPTGIAGDMCLGALVDAGVPLAYLSEQLSRLGLAAEYRLSAELVRRNGQQGTKVQVHLVQPPAQRSTEAGVDAHTTFNHEAHSHEHSHTRHLPEIEQLIIQANLSDRATRWSLAVFRRLAEAEGAVHGISPAEVHFHEVGAIDAIVDIVGTCIGLDWLGIEQIHCSPLPVGGGTIRAAHGRLPVPAPAVLKLFELRQIPIYSNGIDRELVTPTGAAIATTLATHFGAPPPMILRKVGLGAGGRDLALPNLLRLWIGETDAIEFHHHASIESHHPHPHASDSIEPIAVLETQIDDCSPQAIGYVFERLFASGAVDVFTQAIGMKKSRPGILLSVVCPIDRVTACQTVLFRETTTLGIRRSLQERTILQREMQSIETPYGAVRIKVARPTTGEILNVQPEYEDCADIARRIDRPWREIHQIALAKARSKLGLSEPGYSD